MSNNMLKRAMMVRAIVDAHYEPGRQDRNRRWVFRNVVLKTYPISERTFWRYLKLTANMQPDSAAEENKNQLKLF